MYFLAPPQACCPSQITSPPWVETAARESCVGRACDGQRQSACKNTKQCHLRPTHGTQTLWYCVRGHPPGESMCARPSSPRVPLAHTYAPDGVITAPASNRPTHLPSPHSAMQWREANGTDTTTLAYMHKSAESAGRRGRASVPHSFFCPAWRMGLTSTASPATRSLDMSILARAARHSSLTVRGLVAARGEGGMVHEMQARQ